MRQPAYGGAPLGASVCKGYQRQRFNL